MKSLNEIAFSSSIEVINKLIISKELEFINEETHSGLRNDIELITAKLNSLHRSRTKPANK